MFLVSFAWSLFLFVTASFPDVFIRKETRLVTFVSSADVSFHKRKSLFLKRLSGKYMNSGLISTVELGECSSVCALSLSIAAQERSYALSLFTYFQKI